MSYTRMAPDIPEVQHKDDVTHWSTKITVKGGKEHHSWGDMFAVLVGNSKRRIWIVVFIVIHIDVNKKKDVRHVTVILLGWTL